MLPILLLVFAILNGAGVGVAGHSYGSLSRRTRQDTFISHRNFDFPKFTPYAPPPRVFSTYNSVDEIPPLLKPYCDLLQYLDSKDSCQIPNSLHPVKGSCTRHLRCFRFRSGRTQPLEMACAVGTIFSPVSNQCEDLRLQTTFKEDYCPQIYCDTTEDKAQPKPDTGTFQNRFVFPVIPDRPSTKDPDPLCPPPDEDLEFGPVQKCKPRLNLPNTGAGGKYGFYVPVKPTTVTPRPVTGYGGLREQGQDNKFYEPPVPPPGVDPNYGKEPTRMYWPQTPPQTPQPQPTPGISKGEYYPAHKVPLLVPPVRMDKDRKHGHGHGHHAPPSTSTELYEPPVPEAQPVTPHYDDEPLAPEQGASTAHHGRGRNSASGHLPLGNVGQFILLLGALIWHLY